MDPISGGMMAAQAIGGVANVVGGLIGGGARRREQRRAKREMEAMKTQYMGLDTSNLYANMENTAEDLTVNTQAADFAAQQNQMSQANIMSNMSGAAGGSGIAALAQAMSNQAAQQNQAASASIAQQESSNQAAAAQQAASNQSMERQGAGMARQLQYEKTGTLLGMAQQRLGAANQAREAAKQQVIGGIGQVGSAVASGLQGPAAAVQGAG
mgnify:FL=1